MTKYEVLIKNVIVGRGGDYMFGRKGGLKMLTCTAINPSPLSCPNTRHNYGSVRNIATCFSAPSVLKITSDMCGLPCNVTVYEPSLSYADLSSLNIDSLVLSIPERKALVGQQYRHALDSLHRLDEDIIRSDNTTLSNLLYHSQTLHESVTNATAYIYQDYETTVAEVTTALEKDIYLVYNLQTELSMNAAFDDHRVGYLLEHCLKDFLTKVLPPIDFIPEWISSTRDFIAAQPPDAFSLPMSYEKLSMDGIIQHCDEEAGQGNPPPPQPDEDLSVDSVNNTLYMFRDLYYYLSYDGALEALGISYNEAVARVYDDFEDRDPSKVAQHQTCLTFAASNTTSLHDFETLRGAIQDVLDAPEKDALLSALEHLQKVMATYQESWYNEVFNDYNTCLWMTYAVKTSGRETYEAAAYSLESAITDLDSVSHTAEKLSKHLLHVSQFVNTSFSCVFQYAELYLRNSLIKLDLCEQFLNTSLDFSLQMLTNHIQNINDHENALEISSTAMESQINTAFASLFDAHPPVLDTETMRRFQFLQRANNSGDSELQALWDTLGEARRTKSKQITRTIIHVSAYHSLTCTNQSRY